jgi:hypothetical protein
MSGFAHAGSSFSVQLFNGFIPKNTENSMQRFTLIFVIIHICMTTTGHTVFTHIKAMITGWEDVEEGATIEEWEKAN